MKRRSAPVAVLMPDVLKRSCFKASRVIISPDDSWIPAAEPWALRELSAGRFA